MKSRPTTLLAAFAAVLLLAAAGCGGGSDSADSSSTSTDSTTSSSGGGKEQRLTQAQWAEYLQQKGDAQKVNQAALKTFPRCRVLIDRNAPPKQVQACFGGSTGSVVAAGQDLLPFIESQGQNLAGACSTANGNLYTSIKLYTSTVNALDLAIQGGSVPEVNDVDTAKKALVGAQASTAAFETACKPA